MMKITIQKTSIFTFNTQEERKRINECFKDKPLMHKKLLKLMDLIEAEKWVEASNELESKWWMGRDKEQECPRLEFIGMLEADGDIDTWTTYDNLIWNMVNYPETYKLIEKK